MKDSPFREINSLIARQEIYSSSPVDFFLSQMNPVHNLPPYFLKSILLLFSYLRLRFASGLFASDLPRRVSSGNTHYA